MIQKQTPQIIIKSCEREMIKPKLEKQIEIIKTINEFFK